MTLMPEDDFWDYDDEEWADYSEDDDADEEWEDRLDDPTGLAYHGEEPPF